MHSDRGLSEPSRVKCVGTFENDGKNEFDTFSFIFSGNFRKMSFYLTSGTFP